MDDVGPERGASFTQVVSLGAVAVIYEQRSGCARTQQLIEEIASGKHGATLRSQVAAWHPAASRDQVEEAFQEACLRAQRSCRGQTQGEVYVWLRTTAHRELGHMERRARHRSRRERLADASARGIDAFTSVESPEDELIRREDEAELQRATRALLDRLSERQRMVAALHSRGRKRPEIAAQLGLSPRTVKRTLERIMTISRAELVRLSGQGCESGETLISRFAFGLAGPREMREAQQHLATCPRCGALYEQLDVWRERVAAALPVSVVEKAHPGWIDRVLHGAADRLSALTHRGGSRQGGLRDRIGDATAHVKQHATSVYYRAVDPTPLAGVRPGAAAATVAGCLAIGGGATYCLQQGVGPIQGLVGAAAPTHQQKHHPKRHEEARAVQPSGTPADPVAQTPAVTTPTQPVTQTRPRRSRPQPPPKPQDEFTPGGPTAATATVHSGSSPSTKPTPAPAGGPGEFGGP